MITDALALMLVLALPPAPTGSLTVEQALELMHHNLPALRLAQANTAQFRAVTDQYVGAWFPTASISLNAKKTTANGAFSPGFVSSPGGPTDQFYNSLSNSASLNQLIWDFGNTTNKISAADETANSYAQQERVAQLQADFALRSAFFTAAADRALVTVAEENLTNNEAHLKQSQAYLKAGTVTEIDVATSRANRANAKLLLTTAKNNYATAKTRLNQAMGVEGDILYEVQPPPNVPLPNEEAALEILVDEGLTDRPEEASLRAQLRSTEYSIKDYMDNWFPTISANAAATANGGTDTVHGATNLVLVPNLSVGVAVTWQANLGPVIPSLVRQQIAQRDQVLAMLDALRLQVRVDVATAQLAVKTALESLVDAHDALDAAKDQLRLADGRYQAGVGNQTELGDAELAAAQASSQDVAALFTLHTARAQLLEALGRK